MWSPSRHRYLIAGHAVVVRQAAPLPLVPFLRTGCLAVLTRACCDALLYIQLFVYQRLSCSDHAIMRFQIHPDPGSLGVRDIYAQNEPIPTKNLICSDTFNRFSKPAFKFELEVLCQGPGTAVFSHSPRTTPSRTARERGARSPAPSPPPGRPRPAPASPLSPCVMVGGACVHKVQYFIAIYPGSYSILAHNRSRPRGQHQNQSSQERSGSIVTEPSVKKQEENCTRY